MAKKTRPPQKPRHVRIELMDPEILDVAGAAELLGVSTRTIYNMVKCGELPAKKVGKEWRFSRRTLINWISGKTEANGALGLDQILKNTNVKVLK